MRQALTGSLGTIDVTTGHPYVSLVAVATDPGGAPILLLSALARHTRNLIADRRVSLMVDCGRDNDDPLANGRATLIGHARREHDPETTSVLSRRFLSRHPEAESYAQFADFGFWSLDPSSAHWIGGFGRIVEVGAADFIDPWQPSDPIVASERLILEQLPASMAAALPPALSRAAAGASPWCVTGFDSTGVDFRSGRVTHRHWLSHRIIEPTALHHFILQLRNEN